MVSLSAFLEEVTLSQYAKPRNSEVVVLDTESGDTFCVTAVRSSEGSLVIEVNLSEEIKEGDHGF